MFSKHAWLPFHHLPTWLADMRVSASPGVSCETRTRDECLEGTRVTATPMTHSRFQSTTEAATSVRATAKHGVRSGGRTRDLLLGKQTHYLLCYANVRRFASHCDNPRLSLAKREAIPGLEPDLPLYQSGVLPVAPYGHKWKPQGGIEPPPQPLQEAGGP